MKKANDEETTKEDKQHEYGAQNRGRKKRTKYKTKKEKEKKEQNWE